MKEQSASNQFLQQWQNNQRLRLGGWLILAILLIYSGIFCMDLRKNTETESQVLYERLGKLQNLTQQSKWFERAKSARSMRVEMESQLLKAESRGLAQANIQSWLDKKIKKIQIENTRVQVDQARSVSGYPDLLEVTASIEAPFERKKLLDLLKTIETVNIQW